MKQKTTSSKAKPQRFLTNALLAALLIILPAFFLFTPPNDPDFGWHYQYGKQIFENLQVAKTNTFSYTMPNYFWADSYWLCELFLYWTHAYLGHALAGVLAGLALGFIIYAFAKNPKPVTMERVVMVMIFLIAISVTANVVRPIFFSTIFLLILLYTLLKEEKSVVFLPFIFLVWANIHADFVLGLFIFCMYVFEKGVELWRNRKFSSVLKLVTILLTSFLATLINPYGLQLWTTLLKEISLVTAGSSVAEWSSIAVLGIGMFSMIAFLILAFGIVVLAARQKMQWWHFVATMVFMVLSIKAVYMTRIFFTLAFPVLLDAYDLAKAWLPKHTILLSLVTQSFFFLILMATIGKFNNNFIAAYNLSIWSVDSKYPYEAVRYIAAAKPSGQMFNNYDWGGYLIWQLPQYKTFIDGRMTSWRHNGISLISDYNKIEKAPAENKALMDQYFLTYNVGFVLERPDSTLVKYLKQENWNVAYSDNVAVVLTKP